LPDYPNSAIPSRNKKLRTASLVATSKRRPTSQAAEDPAPPVP